MVRFRPGGTHHEWSLPYALVQVVCAQPLRTGPLWADVLSFSRSKGFYGGISLDGAVVATRGNRNDAHYGKEVTTADILIRHDVSNSQAMALINTVTTSACMDPKSGRC